MVHLMERYGISCSELGRNFPGGKHKVTVSRQRVKYVVLNSYRDLLIKMIGLENYKRDLVEYRERRGIVTEE